MLSTLEVKPELVSGMSRIARELINILIHQPRATLTFFGNAPTGWEGQETAPSDTTLSRYIALENRTGLQRLGKTIMSG
jgi:hypothetical protein